MMRNETFDPAAISPLPSPAEAEDSDYPGTARRWALVAILSLAVLLSYGDRLIINLVADGIQRELVLTHFSISLVMGSGFALLYALFGVPVGRLADRLNRRNLVIAGVALWCLATAACGAATGFGQLFAARMFVGLGEAVLMPAATSLIADSFPARQRGRAFGLFHIGAVIGSGMALGLGGILLASVEGGLLADVPGLGGLPAWRNVMLLAALPGIPVCLLLLTVREPARLGLRGAQKLGALVRASLAQRGRVARTCLCVGVVAAGDYGLLSWLPTVLRAEGGDIAARAGQSIGLMVAIGGLGGCFLGGWLADWFARRGGLPARIWAMRLSYGLCAVSVPLFLFASADLLLAATALWVLGSVSGIVVANAYLPEAVGNEHRATVIAFSNICSAIIGMGLGPTLVVALSWLMPGGEANALRLGIAALCALTSIAAALLLAWRLAPVAEAQA